MIDISPLVKYALIGLAFLGFCAGLIAYGSHRKQLEWDAAVMQQQIDTGEFIVKQAYETSRADREHQQQIQKLSADTTRLTKKVRIYEHATAKKCELSIEYERIFDHISRLRKPAADGLPAAPDATRVADGPARTPLTDAATLPAYQGAVTQLYACTDQLNALIAWVRNSTTIAMEGAGR